MRDSGRSSKAGSRGLRSIWRIVFFDWSCRRLSFQASLLIHRYVLCLSTTRNSIDRISTSCICPVPGARLTNKLTCMARRTKQPIFLFRPCWHAQSSRLSGNGKACTDYIHADRAGEEQQTAVGKGLTARTAPQIPGRLGEPVGCAPPDLSTSASTWLVGKPQFRWSCASNILVPRGYLVAQSQTFGSMQANNAPQLGICALIQRQVCVFLI